MLCYGWPSARRHGSPQTSSLWLGLSAQIGAGVFYVLSRFNRYALLLVILCLALNWLGDRLDGTLARVAVSSARARA